MTHTDAITTTSGQNDRKTWPIRAGENLRDLIDGTDGLDERTVADLMRRRGHDWDTDTVARVEQGHRRLRDTEAADLAATIATGYEARRDAFERLTGRIPFDALSDSHVMLASAALDLVDAIDAYLEQRRETARLLSTLEVTEEWFSGGKLAMADAELTDRTRRLMALLPQFPDGKDAA